MLSDADHFRLVCLIFVEESGKLPDGCDGDDLWRAGLIVELDAQWIVTDAGTQFIAAHGTAELKTEWARLRMRRRTGWRS